MKKDTESKNIDSMNSVFIVMKINCSVTAEQNSALTASLEEKSLGCWLLLGMTVWTTRVCCGIPFPVCAPGCPLGPWAGWCAACERSFWPQVWWTQAARRACRPGSAPQPWQGSPAGARYKCWCDTSENRRNRSKNFNTSMKHWFRPPYPVIWGSCERCCWHWDLNIYRGRHQKWSSVFVPVKVFTVVTGQLFRKNITLWRFYSGTLFYLTGLKRWMQPQEVMNYLWNDIKSCISNRVPITQIVKHYLFHWLSKWPNKIQCHLQAKFSLKNTRSAVFLFLRENHYW